MSDCNAFLTLCGDLDAGGNRIVGLGAAQGAGDAPRFDQLPFDFSWPQLFFKSSTALGVRSVKGRLVPMPDGSGGVVWLDSAGAQFGGANDFAIDNNGNPFGLSANTFYYLYLHLDAGTLTAEFSTTGWVWGAYGYPQKSGDAARLCVGCVYVDASIVWAYSGPSVHVFSFFNQEDVGRIESLSVTNGTSTSEVPWAGSPITLATPYPLPVNAGISGYFWIAIAPTSFKTRIFVDGAPHGTMSYQSLEVVTRAGNAAYTTIVSISAGLHSFEARWSLDASQMASALGELWIRASGQY